MANNDDVYVQTFITKMKMPGGKTRTGKFMGIALFSPEEFEKISEKYETLDQLFVEDEQCILMGKPIHIEEAITGDEKHDIVEMVREELRKEHHDQLKESPDKKE